MPRKVKGIISNGKALKRTEILLQSVNGRLQYTAEGIMIAVKIEDIRRELEEEDD